MNAAELVRMMDTSSDALNVAEVVESPFLRLTDQWDLLRSATSRAISSHPAPGQAASQRAAKGSRGLRNRASILHPIGPRTHADQATRLDTKKDLTYHPSQSCGTVAFFGESDAWK